MLSGCTGVSEVESAASAEDALVALGAAERFDAVFLDVRMPGLDGLELGARAAPLRASARARVRLRPRRLRGRRVRARGARLPRQAGVAAAARGGGRARGAGPARGRADFPMRSTTTCCPSTRCGAAGRGCSRAPRSSCCRRTATTCACLSDEGRFLLRARLGELEERWAAHGFLRVHRGFVVNLRRAVEVRPRLNGTAVLVMADGTEVPIARRQVGELRRKLSV